MELSVHGIGGPSPTSTLASSDPETSPRADEFAFAIWRSEPQARSAVRTTATRDGVGVYQWAPLTSGSWFFALWPVLLPFTLANVAGWMGPRRGSSRVSQLAGSVTRGLVLLLGWAMTMATVVWVVWLGQILSLYFLRDRALTTAKVVGLVGAVAAVGLIVLIATYTGRGFERCPHGCSWCAPRREVCWIGCGIERTRPPW